MANSDEAAIRVESVSKAFRLPHEKQTSVKSLFVNMFRGKRTFEKQQVLDDVSFDIKKGEFFGIVGRNGSGKSTLLKLISGIYEADDGRIMVNGKLIPFIELGVGFNYELSGRENVYLNGALLGFSRKEMTAMYHDIVAFAGLERFMDQKLKNYSSGMQVRLAFSVAIRAKCDILVMDEVLAVGDTSFQQKCFDTFAELKKAGVTIVLVTHDMSAVLRFCDRAMLLNKGKIVDVKDPKTIADKYLELNFEAGRESTSPEGNKKLDKNLPTISSVEIHQGDQTASSLETGSSAQIILNFKNLMKQPIHFGLQIFNEAGTYCFGTNTKISGLEPTSDPKGEKKLTMTLDLVPGRYSLTVATMNENATKVIDYRPGIKTFRIMKSVEIEGVANLKHVWE